MDLKTYLFVNGISTQSFATELGVSFQAVHRYLHGERVPKREVMLKISRATKGQVQPNDFFTHLKAAA